MFGVLIWGATHFEQVKASLSSTYFDFGGKRLTNASLPIAGTDVATQAYVLSAAGGKSPYMQAFLGSGTWVWPAGVNVVWVTMCGGGGGAGGAWGAGNNYGGGGGGAQCLIHKPYPVSGNVGVTIGAGGAGATSMWGGGGGTSIFGSLTAAGGGGGGSGGGISGGSAGGSVYAGPGGGGMQWRTP